ncbi:MAG: TlpA family protein disulfide reductase [Janthinobacterium lividum]
MKTSTSWLVSLLLLLNGAAWAQSPAELRGSLNIGSETADTLIVSWSDQAVGARERQATVRPDSHGNFRLSVPVSQPTLVQLAFGNLETTLFLEPGDALNLKGKSEDAGSLKFASSDGAAHQAAAAANNYLQEFEERFGANDGYQVLPENITLLEPGFLSFLDYRRTKEQAFLKQASRGNNFTPVFLAVAQAEIDYTYADDRLTFADLREQTVAGQPRLIMSAGYYDFLQDPNIIPGPESALASTHYQDFLLNYVHYLAHTTGHETSNPDYFPTCYRLADQLLHGPVRPVILGRLAFETIHFGHIKHAEALLDHYTSTVQAPPAWVALLRAELTSQQNRLIGSPIPDLPLLQADGTPVSLTTFRGKLVYLMFWDSRTSAGQREIPYIKPLTTAMAGQPIEIIMVAMDEQPDQWKQRIAAANSPLIGLQTYLPAAVQATVRQQLAIERLPSGLLIAEDGTLLTLHARLVSSRPLQEDLKAAIGRAAAYQAVSLAKL